MCFFHNRQGELVVDVGDAKRVIKWNNLLIEQPQETVDLFFWIIGFTKSSACNHLSEVEYA